MENAIYLIFVFLFILCEPFLVGRIFGISLRWFNIIILILLNIVPFIVAFQIVRIMSPSQFSFGGFSLEVLFWLFIWGALLLGRYYSFSLSKISILSPKIISLVLSIIIMGFSQYLVWLIVNSGCLGCESADATLGKDGYQIILSENAK